MGGMGMVYGIHPFVIETSLRPSRLVWAYMTIAPLGLIDTPNNPIGRCM